MSQNHKLGNPAVMAAAASDPDVIKAGTKIVVSTVDDAKNTIKIGVSLVAVGISAWWINKKFKEIRKQNFVNKNAHLPDVQIAMIMRKAMFRIEFGMFPFNMISIPDGTNEAMLYKLAKQVSSLEAVIKAYSILFESNLALDIYSELGDTELVKFYESLGSKGKYEEQFNANGSVKPQKPYQVGAQIVVGNPKGTTVFQSEKQGNTLVKINKVRAFVEFGKIVGTITGVYKGTSGAHYYSVDMDDFYYAPDWMWGNGWVAHTEVKEKE